MTKDPRYSAAVPPVRISSEDRMLATLAHILGFFTGFLVPLIFFLIKKDQSNFVAFHSLQALFFQLAVLVLYLFAAASMFVLIGCLLLPVVLVLDIYVCVSFAIKAHKCEWAEIPLCGQWARSMVPGLMQRL